MNLPKGTIRYNASWTGHSSNGYETVHDALRAFLATKKRDCRVSLVTADGNGFMVHRIGVSATGDWSRRYTRAEAKAELDGPTTEG